MGQFEGREKRPIKGLETRQGYSLERIDAARDVSSCGAAALLASCSSLRTGSQLTQLKGCRHVPLDVCAKGSFELGQARPGQPSESAASGAFIVRRRRLVDVVRAAFPWRPKVIESLRASDRAEPVRLSRLAAARCRKMASAAEVIRSRPSRRRRHAASHSTAIGAKTRATHLMDRAELERALLSWRRQSDLAPARKGKCLPQITPTTNE